MTRSARKYTEEFKQQSVNLALKLPSISKASKELGIPLATLHTWIHQLKSKPVLEKDSKSQVQDIKVLIEENRRLHKELAIAKEKRKLPRKVHNSKLENQAAIFSL